MEKRIEPIIDMHDTWLVINTIQGCTNGCKYCFLQSIDNNITKPRIIATAAEAISCLFSSKYYNPIIPICLLPGTDAFLNENNEKYTRELLTLLAEKRVSNPIILVTKCLISDETIELLKELNKKGLKLIVYLSFSNLPKKYEPSINKENIKLNFKKLASSGIKIIHYYRPFVPDNQDANSIETTLDFVNQYTDISVVTGLKLRSDFIDKIDFLDFSKINKEDAMNASSVWPEEAYNYFFKDYKHKQNVFQTNYCALAQALEEPCPQYYGTLECKCFNHCSKEQRERCKNFKKNENIEQSIKELLLKLNINIDELIIDKEDNNIILENCDLKISDLAYLTKILGYKVSIRKRKENEDKFSSSLTNSKPLIYK